MTKTRGKVIMITMVMMILLWVAMVMMMLVVMVIVIVMVMVMVMVMMMMNPFHATTQATTIYHASCQLRRWPLRPHNKQV